jgi:hypothetical protein
MPNERDPSDDLGPGKNRPKPGEDVVAPLPKKGAKAKAIIIIVIAAIIIGVIIRNQNGG